MKKYLVREINNPGLNNITDVLQVLEILESKYGQVVIANYFCSGYRDDIEPYFLKELLEDGYKFSDDNKYKDWINK